MDSPADAHPRPFASPPQPAAEELLDTLPWGLLVLDERQVIQRINRQAAHWCGVPPEALLGQALAEAELPAAIRDTLLSLLKPGAVGPQEVFLPAPQQWIALSATPQPSGWVLYGQDITPQKRREQQYQALAENTPDVLTRWTPDLRLRYANSAFAAKAEQPVSTLLGRTFAEMDAPAEVTAPYMAALQRVFSTGQPQEHYNPFPTAHGTTYYYSRLAPELRDGQVETVLGIARDITELTQIQTEALHLRDELAQRATDQYQILFESIDQGFCTVEVLFDAQGQATDYRFLQANPAFVRQTGLANAVGRTMRELAPTHEAFWFETYGRVARTGKSVRLEHEAAALGRFYDVHAFRIGAAAGNRVAILFHDMTARKRAEKALRQSEEQFRLFVTASSDALYRMSANWQQMQHLNGKGFLADTKAPQLSWLEAYIPPADQATVSADIQAAIIGRHYFELEHRVFRADGSIGWTFSRAVPVLSECGELVEWFGTATDITARKQAEQALRRSEERLQLALQAGHMGSFEWTSADNRLRLSAMSEQVLGLLPGAAVATSDTGMALVHPDDYARQQVVFEQASRTGEDFHSIYRIVRPRDGQVRWLEERGQGTRDLATGIIQLRGVHWDVTERVQAQQQLAEFNTQLEQQVAARTQELQDSRHLLQTVFDASPTAIVVLRILRDAADQPEDLEILIYNEFNRQVTGRDDLAGQRFSAMFPQTVPTGILARLLAVATTGEPADFEHWYEGEGMRHWFRQIVVRQDGLLVMTSEVITARKQAEQERLRTLRLLEQAEAMAGLGSWDYDLLSKEFLWSDGMYHLFGLPSGQPVSPDVYLQFVIDEDRPLAEHLVQCLTTGSANFEETLRLRVGEQSKTVRIKTVVLLDEAGQPVRILGVDLDISQLQRLESDNLHLRLRQQQVLFEAVQAAQEAERKVIAEGLHNGIGQLLFATKLRLDQLHTPTLDTPPRVVVARREADQLLAEAIRQTRVLSHELVPLTLAQFGLPTALHDISRTMSTPQLRFSCHVLLDEAAALLSASLQLALYRMAQELALNIGKHAQGATEASLELETMPGWVVLRVEDNGSGFATYPAADTGLGLRSIRDRVSLLSGVMKTGNRVSGGAYVRIRIPFILLPL